MDKGKLIISITVISLMLIIGGLLVQNAEASHRISPPPPNFELKLFAILEHIISELREIGTTLTNILVEEQKQTVLLEHIDCVVTIKNVKAC